MSIFHAIILGIIEGVTEFLPISSTAHLIITSRLLGLAASDFLKTFEIVIQSGAILAVVWLYWKKIFSSVALIKKLIIAFIPTAIIGLLAYPLVRSALDNYTLTLWAVIMGGVVIVLFERNNFVSGGGEVTSKKGFWVGVAQTLAFIPGVSRSAATILAGRAMKVSRKDIVEFSFLLAIPTMFVATGYDALKNRDAILASGHLGLLLVGLVVAFLSSLVVIRWFLRYAQTNKLTVFGWYRIIVGIVFLLFLK